MIPDCCGSSGLNPCRCGSTGCPDICSPQSQSGWKIKLEPEKPKEPPFFNNRHKR